MTVPGNSAPQTPAGWYADTTQPGMLRWWDGAQWTEHRQPQPQQQPQQVDVRPATPGNVQPLAVAAPHAAPRSNGLATWSLVLAIAGVFVFPFLASIAAIITGVVARKRSMQSQGAVGGAGTALAGIVVGAIGLLWGFVLIAIMMAIAIPVFLGQSAKAHATVAKSHAAAIVTEIETCAAGSADGSLTGCTAGGVTAQLPAPTRAAVKLGCADPSGACLTITGNSYRVQANTPANGGMVKLIATGGNGQVAKTCEGTPATMRVVCTNGTW